MIRIGTKLSEVRIRKGLTLEDISHSTKIRKEFLEAIEKGDYKKLPSTAYAYGFVRNYAKFLGLNGEETVALFKREFDAENNYEVLPRSFSKKDKSSFKRIRINRNMILFFFVFVFILFFIFFQFKDAIFPPSLNVYQPAENQTIYNQDLTVKGATDPSSTVYVDDELVSIDDNGDFNKIITVFPGKTSIKIKSINRFDKETDLTRQINVKPGY